MRILLIVLFALISTAAMADSLTWRFENNHENIVDLELYADDGKWPGGGEVYSLNDGTTRKVKINCRKGEQICYGAWLRGSSSEAWGAGKGGEGDCDSCCFVCGTGQTPILTFN
jgi:hypothetical protein